jgi:hypothetical protein
MTVTGQRSNQLNYVPTRQINEMRNNQDSYGVARPAYRAPSVLLSKQAQFLAQPPTDRLQISQMTCV